MLRPPPPREPRSNESILFVRVTASAPLETCLGPDDDAQARFDASVADAQAAASRAEDDPDPDRLLRKPPGFLSEMDGVEPGALVFCLGLGTREVGPPHAASAAVAAGSTEAAHVDRSIARLADWSWVQRRAERRLGRLRIDLGARVGSAQQWRELGGRCAALAALAAEKGADTGAWSLLNFPDPAQLAGATPDELKFDLDVGAAHGFLAPKGASEAREAHSRMTGEACRMSREAGGDAAEELLALRLREAGVFDFLPDGVCASGDAAALADGLGRLPLVSAARGGPTMRRKARRRFGPAVEIEDKTEHAPRALTVCVRGRALLSTFALFAPRVAVRTNDRLFVLVIARVVVGDGEDDAPAEGLDAFREAFRVANGAVTIAGVRLELSSRSELQAKGAPALAVGTSAREMVVGGWQIGTVLDPSAGLVGSGSGAPPAVMLHVDTGWWTASALARLAPLPRAPSGAASGAAPG